MQVESTHRPWALSGPLSQVLDGLGGQSTWQPMHLGATLARAQGVGQPHRTLVGTGVCMTQSGAGFEEQSVFRDGPSVNCVLAHSHAFAGSCCGVREP